MSTGNRNEILYSLAVTSVSESGAIARDLVTRNREFEVPLSLRELAEILRGALGNLNEAASINAIVSAVDIPERWEVVERLRILADRIESGEFTGVPSSQGTFVTERDAKVFKDCVQPFVIHVPEFKERLTRNKQFLQELKKYFKDVSPPSVTGEYEPIFRKVKGPQELYVSWRPSGTFEMAYYYDGLQVFEHERTSLRDLVQDFKTMLSVSEVLL